jgi:very-short-patch-repair endonuclease
LAWCTGLSADTHPSLKKVSIRTTGRKRTDQQISNIKAGIAKAMPHRKPRPPRVTTEETREKFRRIAAIRWSVGGFGRSGETSIHVKMREFLNSQPLAQKPVEEFPIIYYAVDFAFPSVKIAIECDGDYFHVNPRFYPDGPSNEMQRRNAIRDRAKNTFLTGLGWTVLRFWECDIHAKTFQEPLLCKLKELGLLNA